MSTPGSGYQPVFRSILDSSLSANFLTRLVFQDLVLLADYRTAEVDMTHDAVARRTNVPLEIVKRAIAELEAPDPLSRNKAEEGRRIVRLSLDRPWGWKIVNYALYREEARLEGKRRRSADYRERKAEEEGRGEEFRRLRESRVTEGASRVTPRDVGEAPRDVSHDAGDAIAPEVSESVETRPTRPTESRVTEGNRKQEKGKRTEPPSPDGLGGTPSAQFLFERLDREAKETGNPIDDFWTEERYRFVRDLMTERPGCFEKVRAEDVERLLAGSTFPRGTPHDREAALLWGRDPETFLKGEPA